MLTHNITKRLSAELKKLKKLMMLQMTFRQVYLAPRLARSKLEQFTSWSISLPLYAMAWAEVSPITQKLGVISWSK